MLITLLLSGSFPLRADILYHVTELGTLGSSYSVGQGINNAGQVTGYYRTSTGTYHAFLYRDGQMVDLGITLGGYSSTAYRINNAGQVVGDSDTLEGTHAFFYSQGQTIELGTLGGCNSYPNGLNNLGQVVGQSDISTPGVTHAFLYTNGHMSDLGTLPGETASRAQDLNNAGQVVGTAYIPTAREDQTLRAFFYTDGQMIDLNDRIDPTLGVTLNYGAGINDQGQIVAISTNLYHSDFRTYLLSPTTTPVPEPTTLALCGVTLLGLGAWVRCHPERSNT